MTNEKTTFHTRFFDYFDDIGFQCIFSFKYHKSRSVYDSPCDRQGLWSHYDSITRTTWNNSYLPCLK